MVERGVVDAADLDGALHLARYRKKRLGRLLVELGLLTQGQLDSLLEDYLRPLCQISYKELAEMSKSVKLNSADMTFLAGLNVIPVEVSPTHIVVLSARFSDHDIERIEDHFGVPVYLSLVDSQVIQLLSAKTHRSEARPATLSVARDLNDDQKLSEADPFARLLRNCLESAKKDGASDIHFEPHNLEYLIRFRVHGQLADWKRLSSDYILPVTSKLKWILNMDLGVVGQPQDTRATLHSLGIDIRASSMPVANGGEKIVLRLQYQERTLNIRQLGIAPHKLEVLLDSIGKSDGLILISGPTGSGKTTTLYALLEEMDRLGKNISTLENPVEKQLRRVNQANILDHKDFASFQRALMRQDPDVILLGEIRDAETADLSLKLASTGHLVLSTIHANGAAQVVDRLVNLGADLFSVRTNLRLSVAQRLVREICPLCSHDAKAEFQARLGMAAGQFRETNPDGCSSCHHGVTGRTAVIEYLGRSQISKLGLEEPVVKESLAEECARLAAEGRIDVKDALFFR